MIFKRERSSRDGFTSFASMDGDISQQMTTEEIDCATGWGIFFQTGPASAVIAASHRTKIPAIGQRRMRSAEPSSR